MYTSPEIGLPSPENCLVDASFILINLDLNLNYYTPLLFSVISAKQILVKCTYFWDIPS